MKRLITISLVMLLVVGTGIAFANGGGNEQEQGQKQGQAQLQGQIQDVKNVGNTVIEGSSYEEKAPILRPDLPSLPWMMPQKNYLWNQLGVSISFLEKTWTKKEVTRPLKTTGKWFAECGAGFEDITSFIVEEAPTCSIELKNATKENIASIKSGYRFIGVVNVRAKKDMTYFLGLMHALKLAMKKGGDLALLSGGMNMIYNGSSVGIGAAPGTTGEHASLGTTLGFVSGDAKAQGESAVLLAVFKKNGGEASKSAVIEEAPKEKIEKQPKVIEKVNPDIIQEATKPGAANIKINIGVKQLEEVSDFQTVAELASAWLSESTIG